MTFLRAGDAATAEKMCRQALDEFPRDANLLCLLGASMLKQNRAREAEHTLSRAVRMYPAFARAHETLADAFIMQGKLPKGLEALDRAAELEPGSASVRFKRGKVLDGLGRDDEASWYADYACSAWATFARRSEFTAKCFYATPKTLMRCGCLQVSRCARSNGATPRYCWRKRSE
jgi:tetratricopeptide (TPR) repeat protein